MNLPAGEHAIHVNETGSCGPPDYESAGPTLILKDKHGLATQGGHAGDLGNFTVCNGKAKINLVMSKVTLGEGDDRCSRTGDAALVIHENADPKPIRR